jgi:hypothetical protein
MVKAHGSVFLAHHGNCVVHDTCTVLNLKLSNPGYFNMTELALTLTLSDRTSIFFGNRKLTNLSRACWVSQTPWGGYGLYMEICLLGFSVLSVTTYVLLKPTFYDIKLAYLITLAATSETMYHLNRLHPNDEDIFIDKFLAWLKTITDFKC